MEYIRKSIYSRPEIRRVLLPLWSAWSLVALGVVCLLLSVWLGNLSDGASTALAGGIIVGTCSLVTIVCYWTFGDSRRPYSRELHAVLEPTYAYYALGSEQALREALEVGDEKALDAVKRTAQPQLALVRYSDKLERVYYSQLLRVDGRTYVPLTDIYVNKINK